MIDHVSLKVSDATKSRAFYAAALAPLGYAPLVDLPLEVTEGLVVVGFGVPPKPDFWMYGGAPNLPRLHVAFRARSPAEVEGFYRAAIAAGGTDNGPPGPRPDYDDRYYGAFVLDLDGHNIEAVCFR